MVVDISRSINGDELKQEATAVRKIMTNFDIGKTKTRVGIVLFHKQPVIKYRLNDLKSNTDLDNATVISRPRRFPGGTRTDLGLHTARKLMKKESKGGRSKVMVVITDGRATVNSKILKKAVAKVHKSGTKVGFYQCGSVG